jgi:hypothetical protein
MVMDVVLLPDIEEADKHLNEHLNNTEDDGGNHFIGEVWCVHCV